VIRHCLTVECDHPGCTALVWAGPLRYHGTQADHDAATAAAVAMGWRFVPPVAIADRTEGPWHYCPEHSPRGDTIDLSARPQP